MSEASKADRAFARTEIAALLLTQWREADDGSSCWIKYGITESARNRIVGLQRGRCSICSRRRPLVVDHCHATGKVRGLICTGCNTALGQVQDDCDKLLAKSARYVAAAEYLTFSRALPAATRPEITRDWARPRPPTRRPVAKRPPSTSGQPHPVARRALDVLEEWPADLYRTFPVETLTRKSEYGLNQWSAWVEKSDQRDDPRTWVPLHSWSRTTWVGRSGIADTGDRLALCDLSAEETVYYYLEAFLRTVEEEFQCAYDSRSRSEIVDAVRAVSFKRVPFAKTGTWHHASKVVVPCWPVRRELDAVQEPRDLIRLAAACWRRTLDEWLLFAVKDARSSERAA